LQPNQYVYLFLGHLAPYKGVDLLLGAFAEVAGPDDALLIAGPSLSKAVADEVASASIADPRIMVRNEYVPDEEMQRYLLSADAVVAPYRAVLTSSSVVLGLSYGLPVVAPALGCLPELVPLEAGILYDPNRHGSLADALRAIKARDPTELRAKALAAAQQLDWEAIGRRTAAVYRATLATTL
jgi:glycosyltransferase involved in cell wall biosynthesis